MKRLIHSVIWRLQKKSKNLIESERNLVDFARQIDNNYESYQKNNGNFITMLKELTFDFLDELHVL